MPKTFQELIAASSLGTPEAVTIRRGGVAARKAIRRADAISAKNPHGHMCRRCKRWVDAFGFGCACA